MSEKENLTEVPKKGMIRENVSAAEYNAEIIKDYYGNIDPFYLSKKDPKFEYRFLRDETKNLSIKTGNLLFQKGAWKLCSREHILRLGIEERYLSPDGLMRRGDTILAFMPKELYAEKLKQKKVKADAPVKAVQRMLDKGDPSMGGKDVHSSMKGIQPKDKLGGY